MFYGAQATDRLALAEAYQKAQKCIWKKFRIRNIDVISGEYPISVPNCPVSIVRRQQIVLQNGKVIQVQPQPRIPGAVNINPITTKVGAEFGAFPPYYDGYSRDVPAEVFTLQGVYKNVGGQVMWTNDGKANTPPGSKVFVDFEIDPYEQTVTFSDYVYSFVNNSSVADPRLILETSCLVKDPDFNNFLRYEQTLQLGGNAPPQWETHDDVAVGVIALYYFSQGTGKFVSRGWKYGDGDIDDANGRASYYLQGMAAKIQIPQGQHQSPIGIYPLDLDGCVQQVSYSIGPGGPSTHWGLNTEFSVAVPTYPNRRRSENLPPNAAAAEANIREAEKSRIPALDPNFGKK